MMRLHMVGIILCSYDIECHNAIHAELDAMSTPNGLTSGASLLVRPTRGMIFNELGDLVAVNDNEHDNN